jgi:DNA adenine methylase
MTPPLKWHGGKHYLAPKLWELAAPLLPSVVSSVETHCGGAAWTLEGLTRGYNVGFVVNDVDAELTNFWRVLADPFQFREFQRIVEATPFSEDAFRQSGRYQLWEPLPQRAASFFIRCRQSLAGRGKSFAAITRNRTRRGMQEQVSAWLTAVEGLPEVHALWRRVLVLNRDAVDVVDTMDAAGTLFYVDPPYLAETRTAPAVYAHEMTAADHDRLLNRLTHIQGHFLLSGYRSDLYDHYAVTHNWKRHDFELPNNAASGDTKRRMVECVWCNF